MTRRLTVVGAALVHEGKVLAAQRAAPAEVRGRWEFPGGKADPGEEPRSALIRECQEELGVLIRPVHRLGPEVDLPVREGAPRARLQVWLAELVEGRPCPLEHLALRWLEPDALTAVDWLPADLPFLPDVAAHLGRGRARGVRT